MTTGRPSFVFMAFTMLTYPVWVVQVQAVFNLHSLSGAMTNASACPNLRDLAGVAHQVYVFIDNAIWQPRHGIFRH